MGKKNKNETETLSETNESETQSDLQSQTSETELSQSVETPPPLVNNKVVEVSTIENIPIELIDTSTYQIRTVDLDKGIDELAESIAKNGLLHPIIVERDGDRYKLIAGYRRLLAVNKLKWAEIRATIMTDTNPHVIALIENIQREDLSPLDEANALRELVDLKDKQHSEIAAELGKNRSWVSDTLKILDLPRKIKDEIKDEIKDFIPKSTLIILARITNEDACLNVWEKLKENQQYTVKAARAAIDEHYDEETKNALAEQSKGDAEQSDKPKDGSGQGNESKDVDKPKDGSGQGNESKDVDKPKDGSGQGNESKDSTEGKADEGDQVGPSPKKDDEKKNYGIRLTSIQKIRKNFEQRFSVEKVKPAEKLGIISELDQLRKLIDAQLDALRK